MLRCQVMVSRMAQVGNTATYCHFRWSALRPRPTARANTDTAHVLFHLVVLFRRPAGSGHIGLRSLSPAKTVGPVWPRQLPALFIGLIGKRVIDFLLVLTELFSLHVTVEALRAKIDRKSAISIQRGQFDTKFQVEGVARIVSTINALQLCR